MQHAQQHTEIYTRTLVAERTETATHRNTLEYTVTQTATRTAAAAHYKMCVVQCSTDGDEGE